MEGREGGVESRLYPPYLTARLASLAFIFCISRPRTGQSGDQVVCPSTLQLTHLECELCAVWSCSINWCSPPQEPQAGVSALHLGAMCPYRWQRKHWRSLAPLSYSLVVIFCLWYATPRETASLAASGEAKFIIREQNFFSPLPILPEAGLIRQTQINFILGRC